MLTERLAALLDGDGVENHLSQPIAELEASGCKLSARSY